MNKLVYLSCALLFLGVMLSGCISGSVNVADTSHCQKQLSSCQRNCDGSDYWLGSDLEACKNNCASVYNTCMGK